MIQPFRFFTNRHWTLLAAFAVILSGSLLTGMHVHAAGTTRYVNPNGNCGQQVPCYTTIVNAINGAASGDTIIVQTDIAEGDLYANTALTDLTIQGYSATNLITLTGGMNWPTVNNWTFQNFRLTGDIAIALVPNGVTINNVTFLNSAGGSIALGQSGTVGGNIVITNNTFPGANSTLSILSADGAAINGNITISNNKTLFSVNILSYVSAGGHGDLNANITLTQNKIINSANLGISYRNNNTGVGNITGNILFDSNTTTASDSGLGITINGLTSGAGLQNVTGTISGNVTYNANVTYKIAVITTDSPGPSNMTGSIEVSNNSCERVELGYHGTYAGNSLAVHDNYIVYQGTSAGTFIAVDAYAFSGNSVIDLARNSGNTLITVIARQSSNDAQTTIESNQAAHILYQVQTTNNGPFNIVNNVLNPARGIPGPTDGFVVIQTGNNGAIGSGTIQNNIMSAFQGSINGTLNGALSLIGNSIGGDANLHANNLGGSGSQTWTGNRLNNAYTDTYSVMHFNSILGKLNFSGGGSSSHVEDNWWGCNAGPGSSCHPYTNGGSLEPHLILSAALTCTAASNLGVTFNLLTDSNGTVFNNGNAPAVANVTTNFGVVITPTLSLRNAAAGTAVTLAVNGGTASVNVTVDSQTITKVGTCSSVNTRSRTIGIYRPSNNTFYLRNSNTTGFADTITQFGSGATNYPIVGDWNGDGVDTIGVYDQSNGQFLLRDSNTPGGADYTPVLGNPGDQPLAGRWTSDMTHAGVGVFRPSNGLIYLRKQLTSGFADYTMVLGIPGDIGVAGDWNGDGIDSPGVFRPNIATFYLSDQVANSSVFGDYGVTLGVSGDIPVVGDWIAQGHASVGVFRPTNGQIYLKNALITGIADNALVFGVPNDIPVAGHWTNVSGVTGPDALNNLVVPGAQSVTPATAVPGSVPPLPHGSYDG